MENKRIKELEENDFIHSTYLNFMKIIKKRYKLRFKQWKENKLEDKWPKKLV